MVFDYIDNIIGALPLPALLVGPDGRVVALNERAGPIFGDNLVGRHYVTALRNPALLDCVEDTFRTGTEKNAVYLTIEAGRDVTFEVSGRPVELPLGSGVLLCLSDTTVRDQAEQIRRDFVANVSHELKTPLTALLGFIETLRGPAKDDPAAQNRFLTIMEREAERMNRLVRDLLSLSRVESEARIRPDGRVDVSALVHSSVQLLLPGAKESGVDINLSMPTVPLIVAGDADQLTQVFTNLIENAVKYGASGKKVDVRITSSERETALRGPGVKIEFVDYGEGFDPVHIPRLTERFYRVDGHRSREMGGTGLGLAIVKHIVNRHRGRFKIDSEPGKGSVFVVLLPTS